MRYAGFRRIVLARSALVLLATLSVADAQTLAATSPVPGAIDDTVRGASCRALYAGTVGLSDLLPASSLPGADTTALWPPAPVRLLPNRLFLRTATESFNSRWAFAARGGEIWIEPVSGGGNGWRRMPLPACFDGRVRAIAVDDDELIALDGARRVFTMDNALKEPALFNWTSRWGPPFWTGPGFQLPEGFAAWSWSVISPAEDRTWTDSAGNVHAVGAFKDSHIWTLRSGGQRLTLNDPWLPTDSSYEMCGPHRGRFRALDLSASGSTIFVVGRYGDLYTRLYDFDISGSDPMFFNYSWDPQRTGDPNAAIQLPSPPWIRQPKVPGRITSTISIAKVGAGAVHRILRVEGLDGAGHAGYWQKDSADPRARGWRFHRTDQPLRGRLLRNPPGDTSMRGAGAAADIAFGGSGARAALRVTNFNLHCSPAALRVTLPGARAIALRLHSVDGLRQSPRATGLDANPREQYGAIEIPAALLTRLSTEPPSVRDFISQALGGRRFTTVTLEVTASTLRIEPLHWILSRSRR